MEEGEFNKMMVKEIIIKKLKHWGYDTIENFRIKNTDTNEIRVADIYAKHKNSEKKDLFIHILEKQNQKLENELKNFYGDRNLRIIYTNNFSGKLRKLDELAENYL